MSCQATRRGTQRGCPHPDYTRVAETLGRIGVSTDQVAVNIQLAQSPEYWQTQRKEQTP